MKLAKGGDKGRGHWWGSTVGLHDSKTQITASKYVRVTEIHILKDWHPKSITDSIFSCTYTDWLDWNGPRRSALMLELHVKYWPGSQTACKMINRAALTEKAGRILQNMEFIFAQIIGHTSRCPSWRSQNTWRGGKKTRRGDLWIQHRSFCLTCITAKLKKWDIRTYYGGCKKLGQKSAKEQALNTRR